jgi:DNA-binding CsgD family transcriptional regulator
MHSRDSWLSVALLGCIAGVVGVDTVEDYASGLTARHFAWHVLMLALAVAHGTVLWRRLVAQRREARGLDRELVDARASAERWRREASGAIREFSVAVARQLDRWSLTEAEREIALLLLKGLAHKEIAGVRSTSERTVRQQALSLYRKAGLAGRNELAAFFLEDLLAGSPVTAPARDVRPALSALPEFASGPAA